jgi:alpha-N-acetylglucosamine transferase
MKIVKIEELKQIIETQKELIELLEGQVIDLSMMSKIELGDDVIAEIKKLKSKL